jgi:hypothetical protein
MYQPSNMQTNGEVTKVECKVNSIGVHPQLSHYRPIMVIQCIIHKISSLQPTNGQMDFHRQTFWKLQKFEQNMFLFQIGYQRMDDFVRLK